MICENETAYYFSKDFAGAYSLRGVEYWQCPHCKFVYSKTHFDMTDECWVELNRAYHAHYQGGDTNDDDPNWKARQERQREAICFLFTAGHLPTKRRWLDWGAGDGSLTRLLGERDLELLQYDKYMRSEGYLSEKQLEYAGFDFLVSTSVFEHVRDLGTLDHISSLVAPLGVLAIHTLVCETVPADPNWFYLLPVHVAFFSNKSMQILFERWKFSSSLYHVPGRIWFFFKNETVDAESLAAQGNNFFGQNIFYGRNGAFANFWKD